MPAKQLWKNDPEDHDFPAALDYLELIMPSTLAKRAVAALRKAPTVTKKAKDIERASRLPMLPADNVHVAKDLKRVRQGTRLSPVLLVRGRAANDGPLIIADGYHRICASYHLDEDAEIPCRLVDLPA